MLGGQSSRSLPTPAVAQARGAEASPGQRAGGTSERQRQILVGSRLGALRFGPACSPRSLAGHRQGQRVIHPAWLTPAGSATMEHLGCPRVSSKARRPRAHGAALSRGCRTRIRPQGWGDTGLSLTRSSPHADPPSRLSCGVPGVEATRCVPTSLSHHPTPAQCHRAFTFQTPGAGAAPQQGGSGVQLLGLLAPTLGPPAPSPAGPVPASPAALPGRGPGAVGPGSPLPPGLGWVRHEIGRAHV